MNIIDFISENFSDPLGRTPQDALSKNYPHVYEDIERHTRLLERYRATPKDLIKNVRDWWKVVISTETLAPLRDGSLLTPEEAKAVAGVKRSPKPGQRLKDVRLGGGFNTITIAKSGTVIGGAVRTGVDTDRVTVNSDARAALLDGLRLNEDRILILPGKAALSVDGLQMTPAGSEVAIINTPEGAEAVSITRFDRLMEMAEGLTAADLRKISNLRQRWTLEIGNEEAIGAAMDKLIEKLCIDDELFYDIADILPAPHMAINWSLISAALNNGEQT